MWNDAACICAAGALVCLALMIVLGMRESRKARNATKWTVCSYEQSLGRTNRKTRK